MSKAITFLADLAEKLRTQDNCCTASPNYCIQELRLVCGINEDYGGEIGWFSEEARHPEDKNSRKHRALERYYDKYGREPDGWTRCGYEYKWKYTGVNFLTHDAAHAYVAGQGRRRHENEIRVYVDSHCYNHEMREVRRLLAGPVHDCIKALQAMIEEDDGGMAATQAKAALAYLDTALEPHQ